MTALGDVLLASGLAPWLLLTLAGMLICAFVFALVLGWITMRGRRRETAPLTAGLEKLGELVIQLDQGQHRLSGGLEHVSKAQAESQAQVLRLMETRLSDMQRNMGESLQGNTTRTARALGELQERLHAIDRAQTKIEKLSGDVLGLQDILSNKQTRGAFGEIQLNDIVAKALPADAYVIQATLSNGTRADCLVKLPYPPGPIVIDAKFPLEPYEALRAARDDAEGQAAARNFRNAVRVHIKAIAEKYVIEGETADGALMFLPSEAVYAELHANFAEVIREGFSARVWIVSPTTCMATLNTMRAVMKDARMKEQAGAIRKELGQLGRDVERLLVRVENLGRHFQLASKDIEDIRISAEKAGTRALRLDRFEFEQDVPETRITDDARG